MNNAIIAIIPFGIAFFLLTVCRQNSRTVGFVTLGSTILLGSIFPTFRLSFVHIIIAAGTGAAESLVLLTILLPAIILYQIQRSGGAMSILIDGISRLTSRRDILILLLVFGFAPLLDAICGMNVGIFVIAPILLNLGIPALRVACLSMITQVTSIWGAMSMATLLVSDATGMPGTLIGSNSAILLVPATLCLCVTVLLLSGRTIREILATWLPVIGTTLILTLGAWIVARFISVELVGILTDTLTIAFLATVGRVQRPRSSAPSGLSRQENGVLTTQWQCWKALLPYAILTIFLLLSHLIPLFEDWLQSHVVLSVYQIGLTFPVFYLPGIWIVVMACLSAFLWRLKMRQIRQATVVAWKQFAPSAIAIVCFLVTAQIMQESGMIAAFGAAAVALGTHYIWFSPWIGALAGWATGSTISGNVLVAPLQQSIALKTGLSVSWIVAAQNTACSLGKILSPSSIILSGVASGLPAGQERFVLKHVGLPVFLSLMLLTSLLGLLAGGSV